jgi:Putative prokaryotic signal transducing protein
VIKVFVAQHPTEAHFLKGLLESNGIPSEVQGEALFGVRGEIPFTEAFPEIWVLNDDQVDQALKVLRNRSSETDEVDERQSWQCSNCGEAVESQFTACWSCNADRPNPS